MARVCDVLQSLSPLARILSFIHRHLDTTMALIVQKYGGTSVASPDRIKSVARRVARFRAQGHQVVVVLSAMSGETNRLIART